MTLRSPTGRGVCLRNRSVQVRILPQGKSRLCVAQQVEATDLKSVESRFESERGESLKINQESELDGSGLTRYEKAEARKILRTKFVFYGSNQRHFRYFKSQIRGRRSPLSDRELARRMGVTSRLIRRFRANLGIQPYMGRGLPRRCKRGHLWTPQNTRWVKTPLRQLTHRRCRACDAQSSRKWARRNVAQVATADRIYRRKFYKSQPIRDRKEFLNPNISLTTFCSNIDKVIGKRGTATMADYISSSELSPLEALILKEEAGLC